MEEPQQASVLVAEPQRVLRQPKQRRVCGNCGCPWKSKGGEKSGCPRCHTPVVKPVFR